jgi:hypothetical protein
MGLFSHEMATLSVVRSHTVFRPFSDSPEPEWVPAIWHPHVLAHMV